MKNKDSMDKFLTEESKREFEAAKEGFKGFKDIDWILPDQVIIAEDALPKISEEQAEENIMNAMKRVYPKDEEESKDE